MVDDFKPVTSDELVDALAFALTRSGRKRVHDSDQLMASIVAKRLVEHLDRCGFVLMRKPSLEGGAALGRGHRGEG